MRSEIVDLPTPNADVEPAVGDTESLHGELEKPAHTEERQDAFGNEENAEIKYKVLKWWYVLSACDPHLIYWFLTLPGREAS